MPKPGYATPEKLAELIPPGLVAGTLLCPHCNHWLYVGQKLAASPDGPRHKRAPRKGASRSKPPV